MTRATRERALSLGSAWRDGMGDVQEEKLLVKCKSTISCMHLNVLLLLSFVLLLLSCFIGLLFFTR
jgi:hypothetical protein